MSGIQELLNIPHGVIESDEEEAALGLLRTTEMLLQHARRTLFCDDLSQAQFNILMILEHESDRGISQKAIGKRLVTSKGNTSQHIARLEDMGLIRRNPAPEDRRRNTIRLTAKGRRVVARLEPRYREQIREVFRAMGKRDLAALISSVGKLRRSLVAARKDWAAEA